MTAKFSDTHHVRLLVWPYEGEVWSVCGCLVHHCDLDCPAAVAASCGECEGEGELNYTINEHEMELMDCEYCDGTGLTADSECGKL